MINASRNADIGVRIGNMFNQRGSTNAIAPRISEIPIKRTKGSGKYSTPVCPFSYTSFLIGKDDLQIPE